MYDSNGTDINNLYSCGDFEFYINMNGLSYYILNGQYNKDRDILFGFGNLKYKKLHYEHLLF